MSFAASSSLLCDCTSRAQAGTLVPTHTCPALHISGIHILAHANAIFSHDVRRRAFVLEFIDAEFGPLCWLFGWAVLSGMYGEHGGDE